MLTKPRKEKEYVLIFFLELKSKKFDHFQFGLKYCKSFVFFSNKEIVFMFLLFYRL